MVTTLQEQVMSDAEGGAKALRASLVGAVSVGEATRTVAGLAADARARLEEGDALAGVVLELSGTRTATDEPASLATWTKWGKAVRQLERLGCLTAVAIEGPVDGLGLHALLASDLVVAAPGSSISCTDLGRGHLPDMTVFRLAKYVGLGTAKQLVLGHRRLTSGDALRLGLATEVAEHPAAVAAQLVERLGTSAGPSWHLARRLLLESYAHTFEDAHGAMLAAQDRVLRRVASGAEAAQ